MTHSITRRDALGLAVVLIVAAVLRFGDLGISEWWYDDSALSTRAQQMVTGETFPTLGIMSSVRIPNPPASVYVVAFSYFISHNPLVSVAFIALLNLIGVGLLWLLAFRYFHPRVAFVAGLVYAVSPWAVLYSRRIWAQDYHTPFIIAGLLLALYGFVDAKRWAQIICLPILIFGMQIHYAAWVLLPAYVWIVWIGRRQISWRALAISLLLAALTLAPFAIGLRDMYLSEGTISQSTGNTRLGFQTAPLTQAAWLATGTGLETWYQLPDSADIAAQYPILNVLWIAGLLFIALGLWRMARRSPSLALLLVLWGLLPPLALMPGWVESQAHYFIASIPAYCLLIGEGVIWLAERKVQARQLRGLAYGVLGILLVTQVVHWRSFLQYVDAHASQFRTPLHFYQDIAAQLSDDVLVFGNLQASSIEWSPITFGETRCVRDVAMADGGVAVLPQGAFTVLYVPDPPSYDFEGLYRSAAAQTIPLRAGEGDYVLAQFDQPPAWNGPQLTPIEAARFDTGAELNGYAFASGRLYLDWTLHVQNQPDYQYFAHVLDANGDRIAQHDASFYPGKYWCANDRIITWFDLEKPADAAVLRIGMYHLGDGSIEGSSVIDAAGNAAAPWIDIPLIGG